MGVQQIASLIGANDGGPFAYQCAYTRGGVHHTLDDYNYVEIVDEDGTPLPLGQKGRIAITCLTKLAYPLIRYDIGDQGRLVPGLCECGRQGMRVEYLGRADATLRVGTLNLEISDFWTALKLYPLSELQVVARAGEKGESLLVRVETEKQELLNAGSELRATLLDALPKMNEALRAGKLVELVLEVVGPGGLPRQALSGKIKQIIDERL